MKVLHITGDEDYHFLTFEQQDEFSIEEILNICMKEENKEHRFETTDGDYFDVKLFEFGEVDESFIDFIQSLKDSDDMKHNNWIVVN